MVDLNDSYHEQLGRLYIAASRLKKLLDAHLDSVNDAVGGEVAYMIDGGGIQPLASFIDFSKGTLAELAKLELIANSSALLEEHFRPKK